MGWFRRKPRREPIDPTIAVEPPAGYFWQVSRSMLAQDGYTLYELGLWIEGSTPNEWGLDNQHRSKQGAPRLPVARAHFRADRAREIRRASQRALADFEHQRLMTQVFVDVNERLRAADRRR